METVFFIQKGRRSIMKIAVACDPAGLPLKGPVEETLKELGVEYVDFGINDGDPRDYPIFAVRAANATGGSSSAARAWASLWQPTR